MVERLQEETSANAQPKDHVPCALLKSANLPILLARNCHILSPAAECSENNKQVVDSNVTSVP